MKSTNEYRKDEGFVELAEEIRSISAHLDMLLKRLYEKYPPMEGFAWTYNSDGVIFQYPTD